MKVEHLEIEGFLGIARARIDFPTPVKLLCGPNGAGKSSIAEALRFALLGESARVRLKKDHPQLVHGGARRARVAAVVDGTEYAREVRSARLEAEAPALPETLAFALDPPRLAQLDPDARRRLLLRVMDVKASPAEVRAGNLALKLEAVPASKDWDGWLSLFEPKEREPGVSGARPPAPRRTEPPRGRPPAASRAETLNDEIPC